MLLTVEDVCNKALGYLGANTISSIDEGSVEAQKCRAVYDTIRDTLLAETWWDFATYITPLVLIDDETIEGWAYLYKVPAKIIEVRKIFLTGGDTSPDNIEFRRVVAPVSIISAFATNLPDPIIEFTYQVTDPSMFSARFTEALALKIASEISVPITGNDTLGKVALSSYAIVLSEAKRTNPQNRHITSDAAESTYINARA